MTAPIIVGFATNNRVPGVYGETVYGAGAISASSIPLTLLLAGLKGTTGTATANQDVVQILSVDDADTAFTAGTEMARMCYSALKVPGIQLKAAPISEANGAVAATQVITISGSWATAGQISYRVNGELISLVVNAGDSIANVCTNLALAFNQDSRRPYTAVASATQVTLSVKSKGARGNQYVTFQDTTVGPSGLISRISGPVWVTLTAYTTISYVVPVTANGFYYKCTVAGTTGASEPTWPTTVGTTVVDGTATWTCWGKVLTGNATNWGGGVGTESVATLLAILLQQGYDRIVTAQNDGTNLGLWATQLNSQAGPTQNLLQHMITATTGTLAATTTLANNLNACRAQILWMLNGETAPWEMSSYFGALRTATEQSDPAASYDDVLLLGVAPQSQTADRPSNAVLQSAVNNGISPVYTSANGQEARLCISITSHSLTSGGTPDYRTFNTSDAYVPDFVRRDIGLYWSTVYKPNNPRVADTPAGDAKPPIAGVATPDTWNPAIEQKLRNYEKGILASGSAPTSPTVAPIIIEVDFNKPTTVYDPIAKRLVSVIPVVPAPPNHQLGVSVRQVTSS